MTEAKDWITAQPKANEPPERTPEQRAAVFAAALRGHVAYLARNMSGVPMHEWNIISNDFLKAAAISAMHPSVEERERIEQIKRQHIATSHDIANGNYRWDDFSAEAIHADRAYLLSLIGGSQPQEPQP